MERASESVKGLLAEIREAVKLSHGNLQAWGGKSSGDGEC